MTYALLAGSPAIDAGGATCVDIDQRGILRPIGGRCDIGAFESNAYLLTVNEVGSGSVMQYPERTDYAYDTVVNVTGVADPGWSFINWSGDLSGNTNPESVTMSGNRVITVTFNNDPPIANAGSNQTMGFNTLVSLDGSASYDADPSQILSYGWVQTGGPTVSLSSGTAVSPTFTAPSTTTTLTFTLIVTDNLGMPSAPSQVTVTVQPYSIFLPIVIK